MLTFPRPAAGDHTHLDVHSLDSRAADALRVSTEPILDLRRRRRVVQVLDGASSAVDRHVLRLSRHLMGEGWQVDVALGEAHLSDEALDRLAALGFGETLVLGPGLRDAIARLDPDVVHGHGVEGARWARRATKGVRARTVHTIHEPIEEHSALTQPLVDHRIHLGESSRRRSDRPGLFTTESSFLLPETDDRRLAAEVVAVYERLLTKPRSPLANASY